MIGNKHLDEAFQNVGLKKIGKKYIKEISSEVYLHFKFTSLTKPAGNLTHQFHYGVFDPGFYMLIGGSRKNPKEEISYLIDMTFFRTVEFSLLFTSEEVLENVQNDHINFLIKEVFDVSHQLNSIPKIIDLMYNIKHDNLLKMYSIWMKLRESPLTEDLLLEFKNLFENSTPYWQAKWGDFLRNNYTPLAVNLINSIKV